MDLLPTAPCQPEGDGAVHRRGWISSIGLLLGSLVLLLLFLASVLDPYNCCEPDFYELDQFAASHG